MSLITVAKQLEIDEGTKKNKRGRHIMYKDTAVPPKWTIGFGRNIEDNGITDATAQQMLIEDLVEAQALCVDLFPNWPEMNEVRRDALLNMMFSLGYSRFTKFKDLIAAARANEWEDAALAAEDSLWYEQQKNRAKRIVAEIRTGKVH